MLELLTPAYILEQTINGLSLGCIYAMIAIGYTMVYGIIGKINFAHGEIYMIGAFLTFIGFTLVGLFDIWLPLAFLLVLLFTLLVNAAWGFMLERAAYRELRQAPQLAPLISAIGASIFLQNFVQKGQGATTKNLHLDIGHNIDLITSGNLTATVNTKQIFIFVLTFVLMFIFSYVINHTRLGRQQRATQQDPLMASLIGINVNRVISTTFMMAAMLAGVAGFVAMTYYGSIDFFIGFIAGVKAFSAAVLGGIGSLPGAVLGGILLGLIEAYWAGFIGSEYKDVASFSILIILLTFRPSGILGRPVVEKV